MSTELVRDTIKLAIGKFDEMAKEVYDSCNHLKEFVGSYNELTRAQDYTGAKRILDKYTELCGKNKILDKLNPIKDPVATADNFSRYVGSISVVKQVTSAIKQGKRYSLGTVAGASALNVLAPHLLPSIVMAIENSGIPQYATVITAVSLVVLAPGVLTARKTLKMKADATFDTTTTLPDFSVDEVGVIDLGLKHGLSESKMVSALSKDQKETITGLVKRVRDDFFVPEHLATAAVLTMLVEKEGKSKAVAAMLNSRVISKNLIDSFEIDPLATVGGKRKSTHPEPDDYSRRF